MSIATFESPQVATQQFFPWVLDDASECYSHVEEPAAVLVAPAVQVARETLKPVAKATTSVLPARATEARIGQPVKIGVVMIKLLKSYGITDEEIAEGLAAHAAQSGLAQAG